MLLSNRRDGFIHFCLAGMEAAWFTPILLFALYWYLWDWPPLATFGGLFGVLLTWMLALELLNRLAVDSPVYELSVLTLVLLTSLLTVRVWLYWGTPVGDFLWLGDTVYAGCLDGKVHALDVNDGTPKWEEPFDTGAPVRAAPVLLDDVLLIANRKGELYGLDPQNGQSVWPLPIELAKTVLSDPLVEEATAYISAQGGDLFTVSKDGRAALLVVTE